MTILELKDKQSLLVAKNKELIATGKKQFRKLTDAEMTEFDANLEKIKTLVIKIHAVENVTGHFFDLDKLKKYMNRNLN